MHEGSHWQRPTPHLSNNDLSNYTERRGKHNENIPAADLAKEDALHFLRHVRPKDRQFALTVGACVYDMAVHVRLSAIRIPFTHHHHIFSSLHYLLAFYPPKPVGQSHEPGRQWDPTQQYRKLYENITYERPYDIFNVSNTNPNIFKLSKQRFYQRWETGK